MSQSLGSFSSGAFKLDWVDLKNETEFTFTTKFSAASSDNIYAAIGFSYDQKMVSIFSPLKKNCTQKNNNINIFKKGDDGVVYCQVSSDSTSVVQAYNKDKEPQILDPANPSIGLSNTNVKLENGQLSCSFKRAKSVEGIKNYFDLTRKYFLLCSKGPVKNGYYSISP